MSDTSPTPSSLQHEPRLGTAIAYAAVALPVGAQVIPLTTMVPAFYAETMGLSLVLVGTISGILRFYDLLIDPFLGSFSDHLRSRFGRRRPLILLGLPVLLLGVWLVFSPPVSSASPAYFVLALLVLYTGSSLITVPYYSWGAEMPATPFGRTRMLGMREALLVGGICLAALTPLVASNLGYRANGREAMTGLAVILSIVLPLAVALLLAKVKDPPGALRAGENVSLRAITRDYLEALMRNRPYVLTLIAFALANFGTYVGQTVFYFFVSRILEAESVFGLALLLSAVCGVVGAPLWIILARRFEIHRLIAVSVVAAAAVRAVGYWWLSPGQVVPFLIIDAISSALGAAPLVLSPSLQAAAIDYGSFRSGRDRAGTYIAISTVVMQSTAALTFLFVFPLLGLAGFDPAAPTNGDSALWALKAVAVLGPLPFSLACALIIWRFPLDRRRMVLVAARLRSVRDGRAVTSA